MELLYETNTIYYNSLVYKIQTQIPNKSFKIKIDLVKPTATDRTTKVYIFNENKWKWYLLLEDNFKDVQSTTSTANTTSFGVNNMQSNNTQREEKIKTYLENIYKLLCN